MAIENYHGVQLWIACLCKLFKFWEEYLFFGGYMSKIFSIASEISTKIKKYVIQIENVRHFNTYILC